MDLNHFQGMLGIAVDITVKTEGFPKEGKIKVEEITIMFTSRKFLETGARKDKKTVSPPYASASWFSF